MLSAVEQQLSRHQLQTRMRKSSICKCIRTDYSELIGLLIALLSLMMFWRLMCNFRVCLRKSLMTRVGPAPVSVRLSTSVILCDCIPIWTYVWSSVPTISGTLFSSVFRGHIAVVKVSKGGIELPLCYIISCPCLLACCCVASNNAFHNVFVNSSGFQVLIALAAAFFKVYLALASWLLRVGIVSWGHARTLWIPWRYYYDKAGSKTKLFSTWLVANTSRACRQPVIVGVGETREYPAIVFWD